MSDFSEQVVIITGGTRGIGRGIAEEFLKLGATVVVTFAGNEQAANEFAASVTELPGELHCYKFDVADYAETEKFFAEFDEKFSRLDVLVNNAGIRRDAVVGMMSQSDWQKVIDTNLGGCFNMSKFAVQRMSSSRYGRIINISSASGRLGIAGQANYAATKSAQEAFARSLSKEVAKRKVTVNCIAPGFINTELIADLPADMVKAYKQMVPMRRFGTVAEIAGTVVFLASPAASYITGTTIDVTGGL